MRKDLTAGIIAGAIASLPLTLFMYSSVIWEHWSTWQYRINSYGLLYVSMTIVAMFVLMALAGAVAGLIFSVAFNKLKIGPVYFRAIPGMVLLWVLYLLLNPKDFQSSYAIWWDWVLLVAMLLDALFFAYLFGRRIRT